MGNTTPVVTTTNLWIRIGDNASNFRIIKCRPDFRLRDALRRYDPNWRARFMPVTIYNESIDLDRKVASYHTSRDSPIVLYPIPGTYEPQGEFALSYTQE